MKESLIINIRTGKVTSQKFSVLSRFREESMTQSVKPGRVFLPDSF